MGTWNLSLIDFCLPPKFRSKEKTIFKPFTIKSYTGEYAQHSLQYQTVDLFQHQFKSIQVALPPSLVVSSEIDYRHFKRRQIGKASLRC